MKVNTSSKFEGNAKTKKHSRFGQNASQFQTEKKIPSIMKKATEYTENRLEIFKCIILQHLAGHWGEKR